MRRDFFGPTPETVRLNGGADSFELDFLEREATPKSAMKLDIQLPLAVISVPESVTIPDNLDIDHYRPTVPNWAQMAELQPLFGAILDHVAVDKMVIQPDSERR